MQSRVLYRGLLGLLLALSSATAVNGAGPDFDTAIAPTLCEHCLDCHSGSKPKGGLDLSRRGALLAGGKTGEVLAPGKPDESRLWDLVRRDKMPPKKPLSAVEKTRLHDWIAAGAPWGTDPIDPFRITTAKRAGYDWWALQPLARRAPPVPRNPEQARNPIDAFLLDKLAARGLSFARPADQRTLIRRLSFDLRGLPPTPEDVAAFERDPAPDAYERLVDRYLASPQYGVRWARHWLDVVRFGESNGFEFDEPRPNAWPYRDWVVNALNADLPYDKFVRLQLAGDLLYPDDVGAVAATGFLVAGAYDTVGQTQQSQAMRRAVRQDELEDLVGVVCQTFLGLTANCARCHDHKFDPIRQTEYYQLTAALGGVRHGERDLPKDHRQTAPLRRRVAELEAERAALEGPVRARILAERGSETTPPVPLALWDFEGDLSDPVSGLGGTPRGEAQLTTDGLRLNGKTGHVVTMPLRKDLQAKTLEAWVRLDRLDQRGGGVVSVQTNNGAVFDALVFGENEPGRWEAGSNSFVRTQSFHGEAETQADHRAVHIAVVWAEEGTIRAYRDGKPYGKPYQTACPPRFRAGEAEVLFGLRHSPPGGNRLLAGVIRGARLYDRALSDAEVAAAAAVVVSPEAITAGLPEGKRARYRALRAAIQEQRASLARQAGRVYAVTPRQPQTAHLLLRGDPARQGPVVVAGALSAVAGPDASFGLPPDAPEGERRCQLAAWITDPKNALFGRVIVNRLWQHHFGNPLVETPNDFGFNGGRPSHPELLDWLAGKLAADAWRLKSLHRLLVTSAAYQQAATWDGAAARIDAGNRLLSRHSPQRLEAETIRDAILAAAGRLDLHLGGPSFLDVRATQAPGTPAMLYVPADLDDDGPQRRTLFRRWSRGGRNRLLDAFDCPDPSTTAPNRAVTTTPLQALAMLNNAFVLQMAKDFARRIRDDAGNEVDAQVRRAYALAYGRAPAADEAALARRFVAAQGLAAFARVLFNSNEFLYVD
jgi:hypothetical protein